MEFLRYNGKDVQVVTGPQGGKHLLIDNKRRYLTKEQKERIFVRELEEIAEKLAGVVLEAEEVASEAGEDFSEDDVASEDLRTELLEEAEEEQEEPLDSFDLFD